MIKRESHFSLRFRHWIKAYPMPTGSFELKQTSTNAIPFNALEEAQIDYALAIKKKGVMIRVQGVGGEPDYIYLHKAAAWIVIKYPKAFEIIDIEAFLQEKEKSKRKSLTSERARAISTISVKL